MQMKTCNYVTHSVNLHFRNIKQPIFTERNLKSKKKTDLFRIIDHITIGRTHSQYAVCVKFVLRDTGGRVKTARGFTFLHTTCPAGKIQ